MSIGTFGNTYIDEVLGEYAIINDGFLQDLAEDETKALLYAILLEQRANRLNPDANDIEVALDQRTDSPTTGASYTTSEQTIQERQNTSDAEFLDLNFEAREFDLRFNDDILISFNGFSDPDNIIPYSASDSPVVGIPVTSGKVWATAQNGTGGATLRVDAWSGRS